MRSKMSFNRGSGGGNQATFSPAPKKRKTCAIAVCELHCFRPARRRAWARTGFTSPKQEYLGSGRGRQNQLGTNEGNGGKRKMQREHRRAKGLESDSSRSGKGEGALAIELKEEETDKRLFTGATRGRSVAVFRDKIEAESLGKTQGIRMCREGKGEQPGKDATIFDRNPRHKKPRHRGGNLKKEE